MQNSNPATFYEAQYGETRLVAFEILQKFFDEKNEQKISDIFSEILEKNAKKNSLSLEDFLEKVDDDLLQQLVIGLIDNIDEINDSLKVKFTEDEVIEAIRAVKNEDWFINRITKELNRIWNRKNGYE